MAGENCDKALGDIGPNIGWPAALGDIGPNIDWPAALGDTGANKETPGRSMSGFLSRFFYHVVENPPSSREVLDKVIQPIHHCLRAGTVECDGTSIIIFDPKDLLYRIVG